MHRKAELLMPAGSLEKLKTAILYGADAVYAGTPDLSLRTKAEFTLKELLEGIKFVHAHGRKIYLTLNLFSHNKDIEKLPQFLKTIRTVRPDGFIIADPGIFAYVKEYAPEIPLHISTQANVISWLTVKFWQKQGADLCVLAREVSFSELKEIREKCPDIKLETFIHGSMCMAYSGRCLISNFLAERGANQGNCAQSCRWNYKLHLRLKDGSTQELTVTDQNQDLFEWLLEEEFRPGELLPIEETDQGSYLMNAKDLCLLPKLPEYLQIGIDSLKVEGRHKTNYYVAIVTQAYRQAIDDWYRDSQAWQPEPYLEILNSLQNRGYTLAFHEGRLTNFAHHYQSGKSRAAYEFAGHIKEYQKDDLIFEVKNTLNAGELIEFIAPGQKEFIRLRLLDLIDAETGQKMNKVSPGQNKSLRIPMNTFSAIPKDKIKAILPPLTVARKKKLLSELDKKQLLIDLETFKFEISQKPLHLSRRQKLLADIQLQEQSLQNLPINQKAPRFGSEACCGKGCNGCLIFWHDQKYAEKRDVIATPSLSRGKQSRGKTI